MNTRDDLRQRNDEGKNVVQEQANKNCLPPIE